MFCFVGYRLLNGNIHCIRTSRRIPHLVAHTLFGIEMTSVPPSQSSATSSQKRGARGATSDRKPVASTSTASRNHTRVVLLAVGVFACVVVVIGILSIITRAADSGGRATEQHGSRRGCPPDVVSAVITWAESNGLRMHPNAAVAHFGANGPWGWGIVAVDSNANASKKNRELKFSIADLRPAVEEGRGGSGEQLIGKQMFATDEEILHVPLAICGVGASAADLRAKLDDRFAKLKQQPKAPPHSYGQKAAARPTLDPYAQLLMDTHYTSSCDVSRTEAERCFGTMFLQEYITSYTNYPDLREGPPMKRSGAATKSRMFVGYDGTRVVTPVLDFVNHRSRHYNAVVNMMLEGPHRYFELRATRPIYEGEEITIEYHKDLSPFMSVTAYGFFDPADPPMLSSLVKVGIPVTDSTKAAGCPSNGVDAFTFAWDSGRFTEKSVACAEAVFTDKAVRQALRQLQQPQGQASEVDSSVEEEELSSDKQRRRAALNGLLFVLQSHKAVYPERFDSVPATWARGPGMHQSFTPTRRWQDCLDSAFPMGGNASMLESRREAIEAVFVAEEATRTAALRAEAWVRRELARTVTDEGTA